MRLLFVTLTLWVLGFGLGLVVGPIAATGMAWSAQAAAPLEVVMQEGREGYSGVDDCLLYAPSSVADINFGHSENLNAGINRWGEHYVSLIRFDLRDLPRGAKVQRARLELYANSTMYPYRDLELAVHPLMPTNAGWIEGEGTGTRVPVAGTPCWNWLAYGVRRWAGGPGLPKPGVDFDADLAALCTVKAKTEAWVTLELPTAMVQGWIDTPESNAGLRLSSPRAAEKGDLVSAWSSQYDKDPTLRPRLVLDLVDDAGIAEGLQRMKLGWRLRAEQARLADYRDTVERQGRPERAQRRVKRVETALADVAEKLAKPLATPDAVAAIERALRAADASLARAWIQLSADLAFEHNRRAGLPQDFALGVVTSMEKVLRRDVPFLGPFGSELVLEAAGNEYEGGQVVLVPIDRDLEAVEWEVKPFDGNAAGVRVSAVPVGYVKSHTPALTTLTAPSEWWPDPLLDFLKTFDCPRGEVQPLWVSVYVPEGTQPGVYSTQVTVKAQGLAPRTVTLRLRVYGFDVPRQQHLRTVWGMSEANFSRFYADRYDEEFAWRYFSLFLAHRMAPGDLYRTKPTGEKGQDNVYHLASVEAQRRLINAGSAWWNVGYVLAPQHVVKEYKTYEDYLKACVAMLRAELDRVKTAGWPQGSYGIYFLDETSDFEALARAARVMRENFPGVPLMTTGYDRSYGVDKASPVADLLDIWVPLTPRYHEDLPRILEGRKLGKQVWWYTCVGPRGAKDLNWFVQFPAIRARLLMGAATWKYQPDGYLYYRVAGWGYNDKPITGGPYTDWLPRYHPNLPDGDGMIICAGPEGPLTTVRLENIRDGIEDYEYWWVLRDLVDRARQQGREPAEAKLLDVPEGLLKSITEYSEDPADLYGVRRQVAGAIERLSGVKR